MPEATISAVAEQFVLRTLASVTPQPIILSDRTPGRVGKAADQLGFRWHYEEDADTVGSAHWGILCERDLVFEHVLEHLCRLRRHISDGGWLIVTVDDVHDADQWASGPYRRHPGLESYGFALAADVVVNSETLTTIVRNVAGNAIQQ